MTITFSASTGPCDSIIDSLRAQYGALLASRIIEAEACDFLWNARIRERYLGQYRGCALDGGDAEAELSRIAILSRLDGHFHAALCLVDGEGCALDMLWKRRFSSLLEAEIAFECAR